jgi:hypothetical protein
MLRFACALAIAALVVLLALFLRPTGDRAIVFSFVGNPLLAMALLFVLLWWWRNGRETRDATLLGDRSDAADRRHG